VLEAYEQRFLKGILLRFGIVGGFFVIPRVERKTRNKVSFAFSFCSLPAIK